MKNWFAGTHGPSGEHLLILARHCDEVLDSMIEIMDRRELLIGHKISDLERRLREPAEALGGLKRESALGPLRPTAGASGREPFAPMEEPPGPPRAARQHLRSRAAERSLDDQAAGRRAGHRILAAGCEPYLRKGVKIGSAR